jgi:hypothetical protein
MNPVARKPNPAESEEMKKFAAAIIQEVRDAIQNPKEYGTWNLRITYRGNFPVRFATSHEKSWELGDI